LLGKTSRQEFFSRQTWLDKPGLTNSARLFGLTAFSDNFDNLERLSMNSPRNQEFGNYLTRWKKEKPAGNKRYSKCGVCVFVETLGIFTYICAG
jgi:hypothetical protein